MSEPLTLEEATAMLTEVYTKAQRFSVAIRDDIKPPLAWSAMAVLTVAANMTACLPIDERDEKAEALVQLWPFLYAEAKRAVDRTRILVAGTQGSA